jgi:hypothetical protein
MLHLKRPSRGKKTPNWTKESRMTNLNRLFARLLCALSLLVALSAGALAADPGSPIPFQSPSPRVNDQQRGFMLIYNIYTSSASNPAAQNTRFNITNTSDQFPIAVHLFFVEGSTCGISDRYICLTKNQTATFLASELDPGTTGYLLAVTTTAEGFPLNFDFLIGDAYVKFDTGFFGNLAAEAIPSQIAFPFVSADGTLGGVAVGALPRTLAVDYIGSRADGNETLLVVNSIGGNYLTGANTIGTLFGLLYNDQEEPHSWGRAGNGCQLLTQLNDGFPRTTPRFGIVIPSGQSGWMKFWSTTTIDNRPVFGTATDSRALLGAVFQRNPTVTATAGSFQGARNLHKLTTLASIFETQEMMVANAQAWQAASRGQLRSSLAQQLGELSAFIFPIFPNTCGFVEK